MLCTREYLYYLFQKLIASSSVVSLELELNDIRSQGIEVQLSYL